MLTIKTLIWENKKGQVEVGTIPGSFDGGTQSELAAMAVLCYHHNRANEEALKAMGGGLVAEGESARTMIKMQQEAMDDAESSNE